jgi:glycosyltransferase involved in cell wall biosynthesis
MKNVLIVGQTPPPVYGQAVMIQALLEGEYEGIQLHYVRMEFSRSIDEVGIFHLRKLLVLLTTLAKIIVGRWKSQAEILYYPPAGPKIIPVIRDIVLLIGTRWMFRYTVFHFHAAGLPEIYPSLPPVLKLLYNVAYRKADLAIFTTKSTSSAGSELEAKTVTVIPNGIPDNGMGYTPHDRRTGSEVPCILFMGLLCEGKGLLTLIEACSLLKKAGLSFRVVCVGTHDSDSFRGVMEELIEKHGLANVISFPGVLRGENKWNAFKNADIFCLPSHYCAESFPLVLIEAMSFQLPIVTTNWRGIPDGVGGSGGAFVVEPKEPKLLAGSLESLLRDSDLRATMGRKNRAWFCDHYTIEKHRERMEKALLEIRTL